MLNQTKLIATKLIPTKRLLTTPLVTARTDPASRRVLKSALVKRCSSRLAAVLLALFPVCAFPVGAESLVNPDLLTEAAATAASAPIADAPDALAALRVSHAPGNGGRTQKFREVSYQPGLSAKDRQSLTGKQATLRLADRRATHPHRATTLGNLCESFKGVSELAGVVTIDAPVLSLTSVPLDGGGCVLAALASGEVGFLDTKLERLTPIAQFSRSVSGVAVDAEQAVLVGWSGNWLEWLPLGSLEKTLALDRFDTRINAAVIQAGTEAVIFGGADSRVYRWLPSKGPVKSSIERYIGAASVVSAIATHPEGRVFFSGDWSGGLNAWLPYDADAFQGRFDRNAFLGGLFSDRTPRQRGARSDTVAISGILVFSSGDHLLAVLQDGRVEWWQMRGFRKMGEVQAHKGLIYHATLDAEGGRLATVGRDGVGKVFSLEFVETPEVKGTFTELLAIPLRGESVISFKSAEELLVAFRAPPRLERIRVPLKPPSDVTPGAVSSTLGDAG